MIIEKKEADYNMFDWWKKVVLKNYANFDGRARRSEYWFFALTNLLIMIVPIILLIVGAQNGQESPLFYIGAALVGIYAIGVFIPSIAVAIRRLHDTGKSGWWYLIGIIPIVSYIGGIVLFIFYCIEGEKGQNQYGPDPKNPEANNEINEIGQSVE